MSLPDPSDPVDPRGLVREAFRIGGIGPAECRGIYLDWALGLPEEVDALQATAALLERHGAEAPHPMIDVLREGLERSPRPGRRRGAGRRS